MKRQSTGSVRKSKQSAGLASIDKPASPFERGYVAIGKFRRSHGVQGDIVFEIFTDFPERIEPGLQVFVGEELTAKTVTTLRPHQNGLILHLDGYTNPEEAAALTNMVVFLPIDQLPPLPDDEFYHHELLGLTVVDVDGAELGVLEEILETGANDVFLIRDRFGKELLLPDIDSVVLKIQPKQRKIVVQPPEWY
jgi:16S rRNA processing protein RimM